MLTYFVGCLWYLTITADFNGQSGTTFYQHYNMQNYSDGRNLVISCYFIMTTLATVGYGDLVPQTKIEKVIGIIIMIVGIGFFSYIMGNFTDVLARYLFF